MTNVKSWWGEQKCNTKPDSYLPPRDASVVSILTFSNGQDHCNENALLNAMYQRRPDGISRIELVMTETSSAPSTQWREWERVYVNSTFRVVYRWYNGSINSNTPGNPVLGTLQLGSKAVAQVSHANHRRPASQPPKSSRHTVGPPNDRTTTATGAVKDPHHLKGSVGKRNVHASSRL
jgi:hypothetical protein